MKMLFSGIMGICLGCGCGSDLVSLSTDVNTKDSATTTGKDKNENDHNNPVDVVQDAGPELTKPVSDLPIAPKPPLHPEDLEVQGFETASHVGPENCVKWPKPITVVLHGNFDRPEWECEVWKQVAGFYGWILCPRGKRTPWATIEEDRWTYGGRNAVRKEIEAAIESLEKKYPSRVDRTGMILAGFSLGGILAPGLALSDSGRFSYIFVVEGGVEKLDRKMLKSLKLAGIKGIGMAMSAPMRRKTANKLHPLIETFGMRSVYVDMQGAGHGYSEDFAITGKKALKDLLFADK